MVLASPACVVTDRAETAPGARLLESSMIQKRITRRLVEILRGRAAESRAMPPTFGETASPARAEAATSRG
jgi:hypothetical protein